MESTVENIELRGPWVILDIRATFGRQGATLDLDTHQDDNS